MTTAQLQAEFDSLSPDEQLRLVQTLWDRLARRPHSIPVPQAHLDELQRRLVDHDTHPDDVIGWADVVNEARSRK